MTEPAYRYLIAGFLLAVCLLTVGIVEEEDVYTTASCCCILCIMGLDTAIYIKNRGNYREQNKNARDCPSASQRVRSPLTEVRNTNRNTETIIKTTI